MTNARYVRSTRPSSTQVGPSTSPLKCPSSATRATPPGAGNKISGWGHSAHIICHHLGEILVNAATCGTAFYRLWQAQPWFCRAQPPVPLQRALPATGAVATSRTLSWLRPWHGNEEISAILPGRVLLGAFSGEFVLPRHRTGFVKVIRTADLGLVGTLTVLREHPSSTRRTQIL